MSGAEQYIAKIIFHNRIYEYSGQQFEDFFISVMTKCNPNLQPVKPHGKIGDRKNDGFDQTTGTYYQVFAPEDISKTSTVNECVNKIKNDFNGLYEYWNSICPIRQYFFVINDKYKGVSPPIYKAILELNNNPIYKDINISVFLAKDLERAFDQLNESLKQGIIGFIPSEVQPIIEYAALNETVSYLLNTELPGLAPDSLIVPDFNEKISFNNLSDVVNNLLVTGSYQEGQLTTYFNENPGIKEILQQKFHALYECSKNDIPMTTDNYADCRFYYILDHACSKKTRSILSCVFVLMSYYFSSCDIFEEPE